MAIMPGAQFMNAATSKPMERYDVACIHTIVGYAPAHAAHFSTKADGHIYQSRDTKYRSAANLNGNHRVIAIENEDHGTAFGPAWDTNDGHAVPGFTPAQKEAIAKILAWCYRTHGIPLVMVADSKATRRGVAYHRQGIDGNFGTYDYPGRVAGGELWSSATGKVCPGDNRIWQLIHEILPRARVLAGLDVPVKDDEDEDDMGYKFVRGNSTVLDPDGVPWGYRVFKVEFVGDFAATAVRTRIVDETDPGYQTHIQTGGVIHVIEQDVLDEIPDKVVLGS